MDKKYDNIKNELDYLNYNTNQTIKKQLTNNGTKLT